MDELDNIVRHFDEDSSRSGYDRSAALDVMRRNKERLIRDQAIRIDEMIARRDRLWKQQAAMKQASSFARFGAFLSNVDAPLEHPHVDWNRDGIPLAAVL